MSQRVRATINLRVVVTSLDDETDEAAQNLRDNTPLLNLIVGQHLRDDFKGIVDDYFAGTETDVFDVDVQHSIVNVEEVAA